MTVKIEKSKLTNIIEDSESNADKMVRSLALQVEALAKIYSPKDTGANANSIYTKTYKNEESNGYGDSELPMAEHKQAFVGPTMEYSEILEVGSSTHTAQPYMVPALNAVKNRVNGKTGLVMVND